MEHMPGKAGAVVSAVLTILALFSGPYGVAVLSGVGKPGNSTIAACAAVSFPSALLTGFFSFLVPRATWAIAVTMFAPAVIVSLLEGFGGGGRIGIRDAHRIKASGGNLSFIALVEPFALASLDNGPNACPWTAKKVAHEVGAYIQGMRTVLPALQVGDSGPLWRSALSVLRPPKARPGWRGERGR
jgi:hypothetical protein